MMRSTSAYWAPKHCFYTDASGSWDCGACWADRWLQCSWNGAWGDKGIAAKELLPLLLATVMWGHQFLVYSDNMSVANIIAANTSKDITIMHLLLNLRATHIAGINNSSADAISRNNLQVFLAANPTYRQQGTDSDSRAAVENPSLNSNRLVVKQPERIADNLIKNSIAENTRKSYATGQSLYLSFCEHYNLRPLPASEQQLVLFAAARRWIFHTSPTGRATRSTGLMAETRAVKVK